MSLGSAYYRDCGGLGVFWCVNLLVCLGVLFGFFPPFLVEFFVPVGCGGLENAVLHISIVVSTLRIAVGRDVAIQSHAS